MSGTSLGKGLRLMELRPTVCEERPVSKQSPCILTPGVHTTCQTRAKILKALINCELVWKLNKNNPQYKLNKLKTSCRHACSVLKKKNQACAVAKQLHNSLLTL